MTRNECDSCVNVKRVSRYMETEPQRLRFDWEERGAAQVNEFVCDCGEEIYHAEEPGTLLETEGWGRRRRERIECPSCGAVWKATWVGMQLRKQ